MFFSPLCVILPDVPRLTIQWSQERQTDTHSKNHTLQWTDFHVKLLFVHSGVICKLRAFTNVEEVIINASQGKNHFAASAQVWRKAKSATSQEGDSTTRATREGETMAAEVQFLQELLLPWYHKNFQTHGRKQMLQSGLDWEKWAAVCHRQLWLDEHKSTALK